MKNECPYSQLGTKILVVFTVSKVFTFGLFFSVGKFYSL